MLRRSSSRHSALWPAALAACQERLPQRPASSTSEVQKVKSSCLSWVAAWSLFFQGLERNGSRHLQSFELVPSPLLQFIGQHWVDCTLETVITARLADVYPPARAASANACNPSQSSSSSSIRADEDASAAAAFEALLSTWSAHTLLATLRRNALRSSAASLSNVEDSLSECLRRDVLPVVSYVTRFSGLCSGGLFLSQMHILRRAIVLVLSSCLSEWQGAEAQDLSLLKQSAPAGDPCLSVAESTLAWELCQCAAALPSAREEERDGGNGSSTNAAGVAAPVSSASPSPPPSHQRADGEGSASCRSVECGASNARSGGVKRSDVCALRRSTDAQLTQLRSALLSLCGGNESSTSTAHRFEQTCHDWVNEAQVQAATQVEKCGSDKHMGRQRCTSVFSPFVGITGVPALVEESDEVLAHINEALNRVALSSRKEG
ncbi:hypothetical protein ABL78_8035 [Leptomonas seymouri]|uniref:Uncharacterized protein n=1 Tax=Leptomonas seymouri TaxID=5684 RepID=A0A0N0P2H2_LEPSE|nr:hypothetical protein ABL78_8035 [Leptomonas seymouri]|eukprot:KPI82949.1 hypothetical protein ABL78_8035 [Leptomonas seymouri]